MNTIYELEEMTEEEILLSLNETTEEEEEKERLSWNTMSKEDRLKSLFED